MSLGYQSGFLSTLKEKEQWEHLKTAVQAVIDDCYPEMLADYSILFGFPVDKLEGDECHPYMFAKVYFQHALAHQRR